MISLAAALIAASAAILGKRYWFSVPFRGIVLALVCYAVALVMSLA